jgi:hypothetical protein
MGRGWRGTPPARHRHRRAECGGTRSDRLFLADDYLRARLTRECDFDAARSECEPNPLSCCDSIDHDAILVAETRHGTTTGHSCARGDRNVIAAEIGDIAEVVHATATSDPRDTDVHH